MRLNYVTEFFRNPNIGMFSFIGQRVTGIALTLYLVLHLYSVGSVVQGTRSFNDMMNSYDTPFGHTLEWLLLVCVLFHMFNGLRIVVVDWLHLVKVQKPLFWGGMALTFVISVISLYFFFPGLAGA